MRKSMIAAAFAAALAPAWAAAPGRAGGLADPVMPPEVVTPSPASDQGVLVPILALVFMGLAMSN